MEIQTCRKKRELRHQLRQPIDCELQESQEQSCRNIQKLVQVLKHSTLQGSHSIFVQLCVSLFCHVTILVLYNWILLTVHEILQRSLDTSCHISGLEFSSCYGLFAERSRPIQRHERHVEQVINSSHTTSITIAFEINDNYLYSSGFMFRVWKKFVRKHSGNFSAELKWKKNFPVRMGFYFICMFHIL